VTHFGEKSDFRVLTPKTGLKIFLDFSQSGVVVWSNPVGSGGIVLQHKLKIG
jgi:hypothetical protein